jgi:hypothetical protein
VGKTDAWAAAQTHGNRGDFLKRLVGTGLVVATLLVATAPSGRAAGGTNITGAPQLSYGVLEAGGGTPDEFWRIATYGGDRLTLRIDWGASNLGVIDIYPPTVDDYTLLGTRPVGSWQNDGNEGGGRRQYSFTIPFSGDGALAICERNGGGCDENPPQGINAGDLSDPFTFAVTDAHAASLSLSAPIVARRASLVTITGRVRSPAGIPQGDCLFPGEHILPLNSNGVCTGHLRLRQARRQTIRVKFVPADGWQATSAQRTIRLVR